MTYKIGSARSDENYKCSGGKAGDQRCGQGDVDDDFGQYFKIILGKKARFAQRPAQNDDGHKTARADQDILHGKRPSFSISSQGE